MRRVHPVAKAALLFGGLLAASTPAWADETLACWSTTVVEGLTQVEVLRCRVEGDDGTSYRDYGEGVELPPLVEKVGADALGECWYRGTPPSRW
ncbi:MAG TPA: hypothetical protein VGC11_01780, partial [Acidimicrobiia bacterium]